MKTVLAILLGLATTCQAHAFSPETGKVLDGLAKDETLWTFYVAGLEDGISWMNTGPNKEYCQPGKLALNVQQVIAFLREATRRDPQTLRLPAGLVLMGELKRVFPC